ADGVEIEEIGQRHLAHMNVDPPSWKGREQRQGIALFLHVLVAQPDDLAQPDPRQVGFGAQLGIPHDVEVDETRKPKSLTEAAPPRRLRIQYQFGAVVELESGVNRHDSRDRLLLGVFKAVGATVLRMKTRVHLRDKVSLR